MNKYKKDFPIFSKEISKDFSFLGILDNAKYYKDNNFDYGKFTYLDNAATSMICMPALKSVVEYEIRYRSNVHRGAHYLADKSTELYEESRRIIANFIKATVPSEVIFTKGATESSNLIVDAFGRNNLKKGDIILLSSAEHSSNTFPWQVLAEELGCRIIYIPVDKEGFVDIKSVEVDWTRVSVVAFPYVSNVLGVINNPKEIAKFIKKRIIEAKKLNDKEKTDKNNYPVIVVDAAQAVGRLEINVQKSGCDFLFFSGHKMYGPMGTGVLWASRYIQTKMKSYQTGGGMLDGYKEIIFEVGTPNVSGVIGLASACEYIQSIGFDEIRKHELELFKYVLERIKQDGGFEIYGSTDFSKKVGVLSFNVKDIPAHDLASILDVNGVAIRSGYHCVLKWHKDNKIQGSSRISFAIYTEKEDIDKFMIGVKKARTILNI